MCDVLSRRSKKIACVTDIDQYLEDQAIPDVEEHKRTAQAWTESLSDKPLVIDPSAAVPEDALARYMAADPRFQKTWLRQREDLKDQSPSGYDLAIANFGIEAGLSEQEVIDLMIHHRRIHGKPQRTRLDYFDVETGLIREERPERGTAIDEVPWFPPL
jgi:hypothetical protein